MENYFESFLVIVWKLFFLLGKKEKSRDLFCYTSKRRKAMVEMLFPTKHSSFNFSG